MTTITTDRARLEELLGEYWEIAFEESSGVAATGNKANRVLHEIRALFDVKQAEIALLKAESEERLQNCAAPDRPDARPHRYRVQGNDAWNHYGTRGQAMTTREAFEEWYEVDCYPCEHSNWFRRDSDGDYEFDEVQCAWRTWQAATATVITEYRQQCLDNAAEIARLRAAPATAPEFPADWAQMIHYPECWDTAAYPELRDAIHEALAGSGCSVCKPATAPDEIERLRKYAERKPMTDQDTLELFERIQLRMCFTDADARPFVSGVASAEFFHGIKGTS